MTPPVPMTGSAMIAAMFSGPSSSDRSTDLVEVVGRDPGGLRHQRLRAVAVPVVLQPGDAGAEGVQTVVGPDAAEDGLLLGTALELPVPPGQLAREVDRVGAAAGQHHLGARDGADLGQPVGEPEGRLVREAPERVVGLQLRASARTATRARRSRPWPMLACHRLAVASSRRWPVEVSSQAPCSLGDHQALGAGGGHVRLRVPERFTRAARGDWRDGWHVRNCRTVEL